MPTLKNNTGDRPFSTDRSTHSLLLSTTSSLPDLGFSFCSSVSPPILPSPILEVQSFIPIPPRVCLTATLLSNEPATTSVTFPPCKSSLPRLVVAKSPHPTSQLVPLCTYNTYIHLHSLSLLVNGWRVSTEHELCDGLPVYPIAPSSTISYVRRLSGATTAVAILFNILFPEHRFHMHAECPSVRVC